MDEIYNYQFSYKQAYVIFSIIRTQPNIWNISRAC
jgi:hypothetical protein